MTEHPILFSGSMVRAILEGHKTQTRRPVKLRGNIVNEDGKLFVETDGSGNDEFIPIERYCPYGQPGDLLWVRETWRTDRAWDKPRTMVRDTDIIKYESDGFAKNGAFGWGKKRPSIHMPRWASRITLRIKAVRVQRVQNITTPDAIADGFKSRDGFFAEWISCGYEVSSSNPWVWVVEFARAESEVQS